MASFHIATWNRRGKSLENLDRVGDLLNMGGFDLIGLQELGGCLDIPSGKWDTRVVWLQNISFSFVVGNPLGSHRCQAVGFPRFLHRMCHIFLCNRVACVCSSESMVCPLTLACRTQYLIPTHGATQEAPNPRLITSSTAPHTNRRWTCKLLRSQTLSWTPTIVSSLPVLVF